MNGVRRTPSDERRPMNPARERVVRRVLAVWCLATAIGIATFWVTWFSGPHTQPWLPTGYVEHERVFVFPDSLLTVLLVVTAVRLFRAGASAQAPGLFSAGMLAFLGVIDTAYFAQNDLFDAGHDGVLNLLLVIALGGLAMSLVAYLLRSACRPAPS